jgi:hypothetical protein
VELNDWVQALERAVVADNEAVLERVDRAMGWECVLNYLELSP